MGQWRALCFLLEFGSAFYRKGLVSFLSVDIANQIMLSISTQIILSYYMRSINRRNFHYLFEFPDILPIFAMNLSSWNSYIYLSPAVGVQWWGFPIAFLLYLSYRPASSFLVVWGIFVLLNRTKFLVICKSLLFPKNPRIPI